eukprot:20105-Heterococcus_DN1.PRE.1
MQYMQSHGDVEYTLLLCSVYADPMRAHNLHGLIRLHIAVHEQTDYVTYVSVIATVLKFGQLNLKKSANATAQGQTARTCKRRTA